MTRLRLATPADIAEVLPRTRAFNASEGITIADDVLEAALRRLLADPSLGGVWLVETDRVIGHAVVTYGYDLEWGGRDSYLTEIWIDLEQRGRGIGTAVLELIKQELRERDVRALHLEVRADNPALRLYERAGFEPSTRVAMTHRLDASERRG